MALCIRTIGIARAKVKIGLANLTYNIRRLVFHERSAATGMSQRLKTRPSSPPARHRISPGSRPPGAVRPPSRSAEEGW